jgi:hypothetical protein
MRCSCSWSMKRSSVNGVKRSNTRATGPLSGRKTKPCFFNDAEGRAGLLGLEIVTDSLLDPRSDRVIPLWPEGQGMTVAFARSLFPRSRTMLDLGTGSGVFSLTAASFGCMTIAVDSSRRALEFLSRNAAHNSISCRPDIRDLTPGQICPLLFEIGSGGDAPLVEACRAIDRRGIDLVMLNAPFHPTIPGSKPALHAAGGEDGHAAFEDFIIAAAAASRPGGWIVGHQMSLLSEEGNLSILPRIEAALRARGKGGRLLWMSCLDEPPIDAALFLRSVYAEASEEPQFKEYVQRVTRNWKGFVLLCFRLKVTIGGGLHARQFRPRGLWYEGKRGWNDRIAIHRHIALSASGKPYSL